MKIDSKDPLRIKKKRRYTKKFQIAGLIVAVFAIAASLAVLYFAKTVPSIQEIGSQQIGQSTKIYDRTGTVLFTT